MKNRQTVHEYFEKLLKGDRHTLSKAITLIESNLDEDNSVANELINQIIPHSGKSIRIGITGPPGVGKSSFIETFGNYLTGLGKKVAVITIDPTSSITKGSILGDKTRMTMLANNPMAYIRPSPSNESLGGANIATRETILLCESAGYEVIIVETVGVGQSETIVKGMVDYFLYLHLPGSGDELQGIKKGITEHADSVLITKADGDNIDKAIQAKNELKGAFHIVNNLAEIETFSIYEPSNIENVWNSIYKNISEIKAKGTFILKRNEQNIEWLHEILKRKIVNNFYKNEVNQLKINELENLIKNNTVAPYNAVNQLLIK